MTRNLWMVWITLALALGCQVVGVAPAVAARTLTTSIATQPFSPLRIDGCTANLSDTDVGNLDYYINRDTRVTDLDPRGIIAYRLRFDLTNAFGDGLRTLYGEDTDPVFAGKTVKGSWRQINTSQTAESVRCSVDTVKFVSGELWRASDGKPAVAPGAAVTNCKEPDSSPSLASDPPIVESDIARQMGLRGTASAHIHVLADGTTDKSQSYINPGGQPFLALDVLKGALLATYRPALMNCIPIAAYADVEGTFP
jgi:hypothetical protein